MGLIISPGIVIGGAGKDRGNLSEVNAVAALSVSDKLANTTPLCTCGHSLAGKPLPNGRRQSCAGP
jgi:hypothetical protein